MKTISVVLVLLTSMLTSTSQAETVIDSNYYIVDYIDCKYQHELYNQSARYSFYAKPASPSTGEYWSLPIDHAGKRLVKVFEDNPENPYSSYKVPDCLEINTIRTRAEGVRPVANFRISEENKWVGGVNRITVTSTSTDEVVSGTPGSITEHQWYLNGRLQTSTSNYFTFHSINGGDYTIELRVVDNGIKHTHPDRPIWIDHKDNRYFYLEGNTKRTTYISPWSCAGRSCIIL